MEEFKKYLPDNIKPLIAIMVVMIGMFNGINLAADQIGDNNELMSPVMVTGVAVVLSLLIYIISRGMSEKSENEIELKNHKHSTQKQLDF